MRLRLFLGFSLVALIGLGLTEGGAHSGGPFEVPAWQAETLVGGAGCPAFGTTSCGKDLSNCPLTACIDASGTGGNCKPSKQSYCGGSKSCSTQQYWKGKNKCATSTSVTPS